MMTLPTISIRPHRAIGNPGPFTYYVTELPGGKVRISHHEDGKYGPVMPRASLRHFKNDLEGRVELPPSHRPEINAIIAGRAQLLGKGDDGIAFRVGNKVVKMSTTVPYQPENPGHVSPEQAIARLKQQTSTHNKLVDIVRGACLRKAEFVRHGDKGFQIKPYVEAKRLSLRQLDELQDCIVAIHRAGYAIQDQIQAGVDSQGRAVMFDVGKAGKVPPGDEKLGINSRLYGDRYALVNLYKEHKHTYTNRSLDDVEREWDTVKSRASAWIDNPRRATSERGDALHVEQVHKAAELRRKQANSTLSGAALARRLEEIDDSEEWVLYEFKPTEKAGGGGRARLAKKARLR